MNKSAQYRRFRFRLCVPGRPRKVEPAPEHCLLCLCDGWAMGAGHDIDCPLYRDRDDFDDYGEDDDFRYECDEDTCCDPECNCHD